MTKLDGRSRRVPISLRALFAAVVAALIVLLPVGAASAHTSFEDSSPANGDTVAEPVSTITLEFSGASEYLDDAFSVLTPDGVVRTPTSVSSSVDQKVFELTFDPPLAGGKVGVRWAVNAPDLHTIDGAFSFSVTALGDADPATSVGGEALPWPEADDGSGAMVMDDGSTMVMDDGSTMDMSSSATSMDEFMNVETSRPGAGTARWGRLVGFAAITLVIGGIAFAATTLRGRRGEVERAIAVLRILGATLALGALLEYVGIARMADASIVSYWASQPGLATTLRIAGGLAVAVGLAAVTVPVRTQRPTHSLSAAVNSTMEYERDEETEFRPDEDDAPRSRRADRALAGRTEHATSVGVGVIDPLLRRLDQRETHPPSARAARPSITISTSPPPRPARPVDARTDLLARDARTQPARTRPAESQPTESPVIRQWALDRSSIAACVGVGVAIVSFWFDGHTMSKGFRPLHAVVNSVHVVAGSIWLGGVVAMAVVLWSRHRAGVAPRALEMVVRFSAIATVALGAVIVAGGVMAFLVLDSLGELFSTPWGQILLLKSAAAGLAMLGGAYNHFRLLPALEAEPDDPELVGRLRSAVTSEAIMLGFVIVVTASLVAAAS